MGPNQCADAERMHRTKTLSGYECRAPFKALGGAQVRREGDDTRAKVKMNGA